jgi:hypothetical protein
MILNIPFLLLLSGSTDAFLPRTQSALADTLNRLPRLQPRQP